MASPGNALLDLLRQSAANSGSASSAAAAPASTDSGAGLLAMLTASAARQQVGSRYTTSPPLSVLLPTLDQTVSLSVQYTVSTFCIQHVWHIRAPRVILDAVYRAPRIYTLVR